MIHTMGAMMKKGKDMAIWTMKTVQATKDRSVD
jgi:hypothetical protein